jgi:ADP-ribose pyrophosphatase YjhB (NUDIX family)
MHENVVRETKEESGYDVEVVKLLQHIAVEAQVYPTFKYQVYLVPYVCKVVGGEGEYHDEEVSEVRWFDLDEVLTYPLVGENAKMIQTLLPELRNVIAQYHL